MARASRWSVTLNTKHWIPIAFAYINQVFNLFFKVFYRMRNVDLGDEI